MKKISDNKKVRMYFEGIQPAVWEHPADRLALRSLKQLPGFDVVMKAFFSNTTERSLRLMALGSAVRCSEKQFSKVYSLLLEACKVLDIEKVPEIYVAQNPFLNAGAIGMENPFITLNSAMVDSLDDEELVGVIGHELAHIASGHVLYKSLLVLLVNVSTWAMNIPLTSLAISSIIAALREWDRKSELSADRAGLLVTQDPEKSIHLLMKMAGGSNLDKMDLSEFIKQAEEYERMDSLVDTAHKFMNTVWLTHPFPVIRAVELIKWVQRGDYDAIMRGYYNNDDDGFGNDVKETVKGYGEDLKQTTTSVIKNVKETAEEAGKKAKDIIDELLKKQNPQPGSA